MEIVTLLAERLTEMWTVAVQSLPAMVMAIAFLIIAGLSVRLVKRVVARIADRSGVRPSLAELAQTAATVAIWVLGTLIAATILFPSLTPASILAGLGIGSVAIGFAFKDVFENFLAGVLIMLRKQMRIGDFIECESIEGRIEEISIRDTFVRQPDNQLVIVPNSMLFKNPVTILTDKDIRRFELVCGVGYAEDIDVCGELIRDAVTNAIELVDGKAVDVFAREFGASSVDYTVRWWANSQPRTFHETRDQAVRAIKKALDDAGVEIPFAYRTLTFAEPLTIEMTRGNSGGHVSNESETRKKGLRTR